MENNAGKQIRNRDLYEKRTQEKATVTNVIAPIIIVDRIRTPENIASIFRLADAAGIKRIVLVDTEIDKNNKKINRIARDSIKYLQIEETSLADFILRIRDYQPLYALEITSESKDIFQTELSGMFSIVVGNERQGISQELLDMCSAAIHIPMYGGNGSMNVAHALAIALYEWRRQMAVEDKT